MIAVLAVQPLLGQDPPAPVQGPEFGGSSPIGLVVTLFMLIALVFLIRSMNKHLRKVPPSFDPVEPEESDVPGDGTDRSGDTETAGSGTGAAADRPPSGSTSKSTPKS
ncbi:MAG TPA: hypothetical protein VH008_05245 [Pseudonocardia sp.]|nr:hypothetical protein [Pseudonocardia sp.]